jgi:transposase-like protein
MAGLAAARARGRKGGRPTVWTPEKSRIARQMYESRDHDIAAIARVVGVSRASVYRGLAKARSSGDDLTPTPFHSRGAVARATSLIAAAARGTIVTPQWHQKGADRQRDCLLRLDLCVSDNFAARYPGLLDAIAAVTLWLGDEHDNESARQYVVDRLNEGHDAAAQIVSGLLALSGILAVEWEQASGRPASELLQTLAVGLNRESPEE